MGVVYKIIILVVFTLVLHIAAYAYNDAEFARILVTKKCIRCDLYKANFYGADLTNVDFTGSNLILANFQKATLYKANFTNTSITGANFEGALWIDGTICQKGSYGKCIKPRKE